MILPANHWLIEKEIARGKRLIDSHSVVFFDVFDTLIARDCAKPADVFDLVSRRYCQQGGTVHAFRRMRVEAEKKCAGNVFAPRLDEIYDCFPVEEKETLKELEIDTEKNLCIKKYIGFCLYSYAKKQGKRIAAVSDMYLSSKVIREMLASQGYEIDPVIVSCEHRAEKFDGGLFRVTLRQMKTDRKEVVHFGDNPVSDIVGAARAGIASMLIPAQPQLAYFRKCGDSFADRYLLPFIRNRVPLIENEIEALGYEVCGPMIVGFCQWLHQKLHEGNYQKALFCARDMKQTLDIYLRMYPEDRELVCYFYASRKSLIMAYEAATGQNHTEIATKQLVNIRKYLVQLGCTGRVALIDSGLHGRSQKMLVRIVAGSFELHGLYMRISKLFFQNVQDDQSFYYMSPRKPDVRHSISSMFFETMIAATHGRTILYAMEKSGRIVPKLGSPHPKPGKICCFQSGVFKFAEDYSKSFYESDIICEDAVRELMLNLAFYPEKNAVDSLGDALCGNEKYERLLIEREELYYLKHPLGILFDLKNTYWKGGYLRRVFHFAAPVISLAYLNADCIILNRIGRWMNEREPD